MSLDEQDKQWISEQLDQLRQYVDQVETRLLTALWASPAEARNRTISAARRAIDLEMKALNDVLKKLEGRQ